jgi:hypothetical protein
METAAGTPETSARATRMSATTAATAVHAVFATMLAIAFLVLALFGNVLNGLSDETGRDAGNDWLFAGVALFIAWTLFAVTVGIAFVNRRPWARLVLVATYVVIEVAFVFRSVTASLGSAASSVPVGIVLPLLMVGLLFHPDTRADFLR